MDMLRLKQIDKQAGIIEFDTIKADFFLAERFIDELQTRIGFEIVEKQLDADLETWLIKIEQLHFFLKVEYYSQSIWLEAANIKESVVILESIATRFGENETD